MRISDWSSDVCSSDLRNGIRKICLVVHPAWDELQQRVRSGRRAASHCDHCHTGACQGHRKRATDETATSEDQDRVSHRCAPREGADRRNDNDGHSRPRSQSSRSSFVVRLLRRRCWRRQFPRSEEHTSELQSLMRISYAVFCLKKKKTHYHTNNNHQRNKKKN